jgi:predicted RNA-binding Zn-ribbon protein involved in translation (DUF1610 family)
MNRSAPRGNRAAPVRVAIQPGPDSETERLTKKCRDPSCLSRTRLSLLADRLAGGLLSPFTCADCGQLAIDPCGRNKKRQFLCPQCADVVMARSQLVHNRVSPEWQCHLPGPERKAV